MMTSASTTPYGLGRLGTLSDDDLLASTRGLIGRSNQLLAALLAYLGEVDERGIYRVRGCASLYTYLIYELRMPEDAAFRRARAAKIARQFPILLEKIAAGEIHLTGLLMLGPHLTEENHVQVLARAKHRTKKEIARLVRMLDPFPDVPAVVEPLGPAGQELVVATNATWSQFTASLCGPVRELDPGDRPKDWMDADVDLVADDAALAPPRDPCPEQAGEASSATDPDEESPLAPQRYRVQFTATQEYVNLLEEARDLLAHAVPSRSLEEVHLRAMRTLVAELKQRKYAVTERPRSSGSKQASRTAETSHEHAGHEHQREATSVPAGSNAAPDTRVLGPTRPDQREEGPEETDMVAVQVTSLDSGKSNPRRSGRYIPGFLELHHEQPHARGGPPTESNLRLRCRAHNALAAEEDFGSELMAQKKRMTASKPDGQFGHSA